MPITIADTVRPSWDLVADVQLLLQYPFMQNAFLASTVVAVVAGIVGYFMVLRSQSFAGHALANVGFAGATGAVLIGIPPAAGLFLAGVLAAAGIQVLHLGEQRSRQTDIAVGAIMTASLGLGFLFLYLSSTEYAANVYNVLFGNVLGISSNDVSRILWSSLAVIVIFSIVGRPLFFASIDPDVAAARGVPVGPLALCFLILLALVVSAAVQVIGVLLIFSLLVTPAAISQQLFARPALAIAASILLSVSFIWLGLAVSYFSLYPAGFFVTTFAFGTYALVRGARFILRPGLVRNPEIPVAVVEGEGV
jgi:zinc/manganese transport system permease protein